MESRTKSTVILGSKGRFFKVLKPKSTRDISYAFKYKYLETKSQLSERNDFDKGYICKEATNRQKQSN
jgi:hypothetical protein